MNQYVPNSFRVPNGEQESGEYSRRYEKSEDHFVSFQFCLDTSIVALFNHPCKLFLSLLFIRALRDLLVPEEDVVHAAVFAELVHGLAGIDFDDLF